MEVPDHAGGRHPRGAQVSLFGGLGGDYDLRREVHRAGIETAACVGAIAFLLIEKGIITDGDLSTARARVMALLDQEMAARKDAAIKALSPFERTLYDLAEKVTEEKDGK